MKKTVLNYSVIAAFALLAAFTSCKNDDDNNGSGTAGTKSNSTVITATNITNGSSDIAKVTAEIHWHDNNGDCNQDIIASSVYQNNGFKLTLPVNLEAKYLDFVGKDIDIYNENISVSDAMAKWYWLEDFEAYDGDDNNIGYFYFRDYHEDNAKYVTWIYVDRDLTIQGTDNEEYYDEDYDERYIFNAVIALNLKKGWNVVYDSYTEDYNTTGTYTVTYGYTLTSQKPSNANYKWDYSSYYQAIGKSLKGKDNLKSKILDKKGRH